MRGHRTRRVEEHVNLKPLHATFNQVAVRRRGSNFGPNLLFCLVRVCLHAHSIYLKAYGKYIDLSQENVN